MTGRAIWISIAFGVIVQVIALLIARSFPQDRVLVGWGLGSLLRLVTLLAYGWGIAPALGLPLAPALLTLAAVFLVTMVVEPFLLNLRGSDAPSAQGPTPKK
jgi:hypothetical protein